MSQETPSRQDAYQAGYLRGFAGKPSQPEKFPGQEDEYRRGHRKGSQEGYLNQIRPF
ncbi:hypothetical protein ACQ4M3_11260 [Leptolyngbya sp. AN03gr2]|uniref:hypothetical protein n=1 Tax=unclassified Leptolyngbya TaxID=2650499 RepID=UPI003D323C9D